MTSAHVCPREFSLHVEDLVSIVLYLCPTTTTITTRPLTEPVAWQSHIGASTSRFHAPGSRSCPPAIPRQRAWTTTWPWCVFHRHCQVLGLQMFPTTQGQGARTTPVCDMCQVRGYTWWWIYCMKQTTHHDLPPHHTQGPQHMAERSDGRRGCSLGAAAPAHRGVFVLPTVPLGWVDGGRAVRKCRVSCVVCTSGVRCTPGCNLHSASTPRCV